MIQSINNQFSKELESSKRCQGEMQETKISPELTGNRNEQHEGKVSEPEDRVEVSDHIFTNILKTMWEHEKWMQQLLDDAKMIHL